ncbi:GNAT family N-acetyltransferase [Planococcus halotolerans]|uniref:GNAT family N-acetyltransferase n=1 Tax=Planococcus halotolerans TaxID=2233542 RepID=A0A365KUD4_9BACL|nr:GNAT family N-acetyltransferase [Planococcus halotolerans]QHJ71362.1 GNAT family N-acetyltransferase [Planococcus halotolerans]RAZ76783.1 GNAT family N-acetyltransferase [Planococcus halotolerans]
MDFQIRNMKPEDIKDVQHVAKMSWNDTYEGIIPAHIQENFLNSAYSDEMMMRRLDVSSLYVAEAEAQIVSFANFSTVKEEGKVELGAIYLLPEFQGKGVGTALLNEGIKNAQNASKVFINVEKENETGVTFYKAKNFKTLSEFEDDLEGHITIMVRMVKDLVNEKRD